MADIAAARIDEYTLTGPAPALLISDELKDVQALLLAFDEMCAAFNELKAVGGGCKDFFADEGNGFGIGIDGLAEALQPLRCVHDGSARSHRCAARR